MIDKKNITHRQLCIIGSKYIKNKGLQPYHKCQYVVCELERNGECPDVFGWGGSTSQLLEIKVSRSDFLSDKRKLWRKIPRYGLGRFRSYLCPDGIIKKCDLPEYWGLLYIDDNGKIQEVVKPIAQESNHIEELNLVSSILRRENIKPKIFSYKKYKNETSN